VSFSEASTSTTLFVSRLAISATLNVAVDAAFVAGVAATAVGAALDPESCVSATAVAPTPPPASAAADSPATTRFLVQVIFV
jgi:hypothetical protein